MDCYVVYTPIGTTKERTFTEAEFLAFMAEGEMQKLIDLGVLELPSEAKEESLGAEITKEIKQKDKEGQYESKFLKRLKEDIIAPQRLQELIEEDAVAKTVLSNQYSLEQAQRFVDEHGIEGAIEKIGNTQEVPDVIAVAVGMLIFKTTAKRIAKALESGDTEQAEQLFNLQNQAVKALTVKGTDAGRTLQAMSLFGSYVLADPDVAVYYQQKTIERSNELAKNNPDNKSSSKQISNKVNKAVDKAKKDVAKEIASDARRKGKPIKSKTKDDTSDAAINFANSLDNGKIKAGEKSKQAVKKYFGDLKSKFQSADGKSKTYSSVVPVTPEVMVKMIEAVEDFVLKGIEISEAIERAYRDLTFFDKITEEEATLAKRQLKETILNNVSSETEKTAASEKLKRAQNLAKEGADLEDKLRAQQAKINKLNAKEYISQKERIEATELKRAQNAFKEIEQKIKENRAKSKEITNEILTAAKNSEENAIEGIINAFYSKSDKVDSDLKELVLSRLDVSDSEAEYISNRIRAAMETKLRKTILTQLKVAIKYAKEKREGKEVQPPKTEIDKFLAAIGIKNEEEKASMLNKLLQLNLLGSLNSETIMDLMKDKYGITEFTLDDAEFVREQAQKINEAELVERKHEEIGKMVNAMTAKSPLYYNEAMNSLWYGAVLSGFGTQDANISFNFYAAKAAIITALVQNITEKITTAIGEKNFKGVMHDIVGDAQLMFLRTLYQDQLQGENGKVDVYSFKKKPFFTSSLYNAGYAIMKGTDSYSSNSTMLEKQQQTETDFSRRWKISGKALNNIKYVGRSLSAMDLLFQDLIKNPYLVLTLRESLKKEGLKGKELNEAMRAQLMSSANEIETSYNKAVNDIVKYDYTIKEVGNSFIIYKNNKIKGVADTRTEAYSKAQQIVRDNEKIAVQRYAIKYLNQKINKTAWQSATNISQETIMSASPLGSVAGGVYQFLLAVKSNLVERARENEKSSRAANDAKTKLTKSAVARTQLAVARTLPFVKMFVNLMNNFFVRNTPAGIIAANSIKRIIAKEDKTAKEQDIADFYTTNVQINKMYLQALAGSTLLVTGYLWSALRDDDDEELSEEQKQAQQKANDLLKSDLSDEEKAQYNTSENSELMKIPKDGEIIGSLDWLDPKVKASLERTGLAKAHSVYKGVYPNGKWEALISKPYRFNALSVMFATIHTMQKYGGYKVSAAANKNDKMLLSEMIAKASLFSAAAFFDYNVNRAKKGIAEAIRQGKTLSAIAGITEPFVPELAVANPNILKQTIRYVDGFARKRVDASDDLGKYFLSKTPILGSFTSVYGQDKRHGMFGEFMYQLPAQEQGALSGALYDYLYSDKNTEYKQMYNFLAHKGYNKVKDMPSTLTVNTPTINEDGSFSIKTEAITDAERTKYGIEAGQAVYKELYKGVTNGELLKMGKTEFIAYVDKLFLKEFQKAWYVGKKAWSPNDVKQQQEKFDKFKENLASKSADIKKRFDKYKPEQSEIIVYDNLFSDKNDEVNRKNVLLYLNTLKDSERVDALVRLNQIDQYNDKENVSKIARGILSDFKIEYREYYDRRRETDELLKESEKAAFTLKGFGK